MKLYVYALLIAVAGVLGVKLYSSKDLSAADFFMCEVQEGGRDILTKLYAGRRVDDVYIEFKRKAAGCKNISIFKGESLLEVTFATQRLGVGGELIRGVKCYCFFFENGIVVRANPCGGRYIYGPGPTEGVKP